MEAEAAGIDKRPLISFCLQGRAEGIWHPYVYQTIYHKKKLFIEAPTGAGKTISTIFPAVKAMGSGMVDKNILSDGKNHYEDGC